MNEGLPYADIVILALIAGFILLRLRSVLGQNMGRDETDFLKRLNPAQATEEPVVRALDKFSKNKPKEDADPYMAEVTDTALAAAITDIKAKDPGFTATWFLEGARQAFEMVHEAFAKGDKPTLQMLLSEPVYKEFAAEVDARASRDRREETTLVSVTAKSISRAEVSGATARLSVTFLSEQVSVVRGAGGEIVEGNPSETHRVEDEWVFERDLGSKNPNWKILET